MPDWILIYCQCKNSCIWKTPKLSTNADKSTNTKKNLCWVKGRRTEVRTNGQIYIRTKGRGGFISIYYLLYVSAVKCIVILQYRAVQHCRRLVHQQIQGSYLKKNQTIKLKFCKKHWRYKKCTEKSLSPYV